MAASDSENFGYLLAEVVNLRKQMEMKEEENKRNQDQMMRKVMELQNMNSRLLAMMENKTQSHAVDPPPPIYPKGQCVYLFRIFNLSLPSQGQRMEERQVESPDFYLNHLGFRAFYGIKKDHRSLKEFGLCLSYVGFNGPARVNLKVVISLRSLDERLDDAVVGLFEREVDITSKESMTVWARGFSVCRTGSDMKKLGSDSPPNRVIKFDIFMS